MSLFNSIYLEATLIKFAITILSIFITTKLSIFLWTADPEFKSYYVEKVAKIVAKIEAIIMILVVIFMLIFMWRN